MTFYSGGALAPAVQQYEGLVFGAFDMTMTLPSYTPGRFPLIEVMHAPFQFSSAEQASGIAWDLFEQHPGLQQEFGDVKVLAMFTTEPSQIHTRTRPVRTLEDLQGLRIRSPGAVQNEVLQSLGAVPINMGAGDVYDALERGVIDGVLIGDSAIPSFSLHEVLRYRTAANFYVSTIIIAMNKDVYESFSPEDRG